MTSQLLSQDPCMCELPLVWHHPSLGRTLITEILIDWLDISVGLAHDSVFNERFTYQRLKLFPFISFLKLQYLSESVNLLMSLLHWRPSCPNDKDWSYGRPHMITVSVLSTCPVEHSLEKKHGFSLSASPRISQVEMEKTVQQRDQRTLKPQIWKVRPIERFSGLYSFVSCS